MFFFGVLIALGIAWKMRKVLEIVYVSALFAVVLMPVVQQIQKIRIKRWSPSRPVAIVGLVVVSLVLLVAFFWIGLPPVIRDMQRFAADLPQRIPGIVAKLKRVPFAEHIGVDTMAHRAEGALSSVAAYLFASLPLWMEHLLDVITAGILCIYFMLEGEFVYYYFLAFFPVHERDRLAHTLERAEVRVSKWLLGQGALMLILGVSSTVVFGILGVRYFFLLGILMGLFNIIPIAGGVITILVSAGAAALDSWTKMLWVFVFYGIYVQVENAYLTPRIMKSSVDMMGLTVLVALLAGSALAGIVGALVAVPTAAIVGVLITEYLVQSDAEDLIRKAEAAR